MAMGNSKGIVNKVRDKDNPQANISQWWDIASTTRES